MNSESSRSFRGPFFLFLAALTWGFSFVTQQTGMELLGPWSFTAVRCTLGGISMIPLVLISDSRAKRRNPDFDAAADTKKALVPGMICGLCLLVTIICQQYGLLYTSVGKGAFITAFYIFLTPLLGFVFGQKPPKSIWLPVAIAMAGLYLMTMSGGLTAVNRGDIWMFAAALAYSTFNQAGGRFVKDCNTIKICCIQCFAVALPSFIGAAILEPGDICMENIIGNPFPIVWAGIVSCAFGYMFQLLGQEHTEPGSAALILSSETIFSLLAGWIFLHEVLTAPEYAGCAVMAFAILLSLRKS